VFSALTAAPHVSYLVQGGPSKDVSKKWSVSEPMLSKISFFLFFCKLLRVEMGRYGYSFGNHEKTTYASRGDRNTTSYLKQVMLH
jgi:hypothetical protein